MFKLGPVLSLRGATEYGGTWELSVLVVGDRKPAKLTFEGADAGEAEPEELWKVGTSAAWRYRIEARLGEAARTLRYSIGDIQHDVALPAAGMAPRAAYTSCNGFSSFKAMKGVTDKNALWKHLARQHKKVPFNLMLMGGDQVYADSMWETVPSMQAWAGLEFDEGNKAEATDEMIGELERFYFDLYVSRWSQPEVRPMLASIPSIMMWDDHDLIDGWGSYPDDRQECDVYQKTIWPAAERAFRTFQQQLSVGEAAPNSISSRYGFTLGHVIGGLAVLVLDMRSERKLDQVLSPKHWEAVYAWMDGLKNIDHLVIMSSIPVVYPGFETLERILGWWPGQNELEDDLADHWNSRPHKGERVRLIHRLLRLTQTETVRPTLISGDVHVAALGYVESKRAGDTQGAVINQLISSGIVHPGPPAAVVFALRHLFDNDDEIDRGVIGRMVDFPGTQARFIGKRNYMTIDPDPRKEEFRLWVNWWVEGERDPYVKVVHPLVRTSAAASVVPTLPGSKAA